MVQLFEEQAQKVESQSETVKTFRLNTTYFLKWSDPIVIAIYICTIGPKVIRGDTTVGEFVASMKVIHDVSLMCTRLYHGFEHVGHCFRPLDRVCTIFNLETALAKMSASYQYRVRES